MPLNLPNALTLFRIFLVPLLVTVLLAPPEAAAKIQDAFGVKGFVVWLKQWREAVAVAIFLTAAATD